MEFKSQEKYAEKQLKSINNSNFEHFIHNKKRCLLHLLFLATFRQSIR